MNLTKEIAYFLCQDAGYLPKSAEPGDLPEIDGHLPNGDPYHYMYKEFIPAAEKIIEIVKKRYLLASKPL